MKEAPALPKIILALEQDIGPLKLTAKLSRTDGNTARVSADGFIEGLKAKVGELKATLSKKGASLQEAVLSAQKTLVTYDGLKISVKMSAFEVKIPIDYSLVKLSVEASATDVDWFKAQLGSMAIRCDVAVSGSIALDSKRIAKIMAELATFEAAATTVAALETEARS